MRFGHKRLWILSGVRTDAVLLAGRWKYSYDRNSGQASLYDLQTDPHANNNVALQQTPLAAKLHDLLVTWRQR